MSNILNKKYSTLSVTVPRPHVLHVTLSRPEKLNAMNPAFFDDLGDCFQKINEQPDIRVVVLSAAGKHFCAGLDLVEYGPLFSQNTQGSDTARLAITLYNQIRYMQDRFLAVLNCKVPVIVGTHGSAVGGAIDLLCMCDIRYATADTRFSIKEVDIGMAADLGTLQFMPQLMGNASFFRQLVYTGRTFNGEQAKQEGFISKTFLSKEEMEKSMIQTAEAIASKSPVAVWTIKQVINRELKQHVFEGLEYMARVNTAMLQTGDMGQAIGAFMQKRKPAFSKL